RPPDITFLPITNRPLQEIRTTITATAECGPLLGCKKPLLRTPSLISVAMKPADRVVPPRRATAAASSSHDNPVFISVAALLQATADAPPPALPPWSRQHPRRRVLSPLLY
ncbi:Cy, partial [Sesbania bispinosa]